jgi:nucleoside-diphosphate-sugar epimerase
VTPSLDVVTGAAGFIGSHLARRLLAEGRSVLGIDSFDPFYDRSMKERNLKGLSGEERFRLLEGDLLDIDLPAVLPERCRIFHLAGQPGVSGSWGDQFDRYARNNILATQRLLEVARRTEPTVVVYGGSSSVYGAQPEGPMAETARPAPISPYGVTKLAGEHLCHLYGRAYGLPVIALRFFSVYGPSQRPDMVFHRFIRAIEGSEPITVHGDGGQSRDFTYIDDVVEGICRAAASTAFGRTFNLGAGAPTRLADAISILARLSGREVAVRREALPPGDPRSTWAEMAAASSALGFRPAIRLEEGLRRQWEWQVGPLPRPAR